MKTIFVAEYKNFVSSDGIPVGHGKKAFLEIQTILADLGFDVEGVSSKEYSQIDGNSNVIQEKQHAILNSTLHNKNNPINEFRYLFKNIKTLFTETGNSPVWFTNVDDVLFIYLAMKRVNSPIIVTAYRDVSLVNGSKLKHKFKKWLLLRGINKVSLFVVTNPNLHIYKNQIFLPDYFYTKEYEKYLVETKEQQILCIGEMRGAKDIKGVVNHFKGTETRIVLAGLFSDVDLLNWVQDNKTDNIVLINRILPYDEYYELIAKSLFVILPYDMRVYNSSTSGVLLDTIFLDSIPIAPRQLLKANNVQGIEYDKLQDLPLTINALIQRSGNVHNNKDIYSVDNMKKTLYETIIEFVNR